MKTLLILLSSLCSLFSYAVLDTVPDTYVRVHHTLSEDSLCCELSTREPNLQLSFLMQGVTIQLVEKGDTVGFVFPDAGMVRNKVKRHPNEVKPTFRQDSVGEEIRPDLQPLITALCDTVALLTEGREKRSCVGNFSIVLYREDRKLLLRTTLPWRHALLDSINVIVSSKTKPGVGEREFSGRRLSAENRPNPNGLGEAPIVGDEQKRTVFLLYTVFVENFEKSKGSW
jgi:hypothetical protein